MVYIFLPLLIFIIFIGVNIAYFIGYIQSVTSLKKNQEIKFKKPNEKLLLKQ